MRRRWTSSRGVRALLLASGLAVAGMTAPAAGPARAQTGADPAGKAGAAQPPVRISADGAEYFNEEGAVVFTGNVVAVQAESTLSADRMAVVFSRPEKTEGKPVPGIGEAAAGRSIATITAQGNVSFRQVDAETKKERYATGDQGVYEAERRLVTMSGNPRLWDGKNVIVGEQMVFHLDEGKVTVTGKVNLTVFPEESKGARKP